MGGGKMKRFSRGWIAIGCLVIATMATAQTVTLESLRAIYDKTAAQIAADAKRFKDDALDQYGNALDATLLSLKQKGDIDGYSVVSDERTRCRDQRTASTNAPHAYIADAVYGYRQRVSDIDLDMDRKMVALLNKYIVALNGLIKDLMTQNRMEDARAAGDARKTAEFVLADTESRMTKGAVQNPRMSELNQSISTKQSRADLAGTWTVKYDNGNTRKISIDADGHVHVISASWPCMGIEFDIVSGKKTGKYISTSNDRGTTETYEIVKDQLRVERWISSQYPNGPSINSAIGEKEATARSEQADRDSSEESTNGSIKSGKR
jgi:hypothetical protein